MSSATVAQFEKNPAAFIEAAEHGQTIVVLRNGKRVARLTPEPASEKRSASRKVSKAELDAWIECEQPFFDSMSGKVHGKSAVHALKESRR
jgi:antitoxin (DNA-binding transcriptional repressor) of toxin-antitoxin stability system